MTRNKYILRDFHSVNNSARQEIKNVFIENNPQISLKIAE